MLNFLQSDVRKRENENLELSRHLTSNLMYFTGTLTDAASTRKERVEQFGNDSDVCFIYSYFYEYLFSCFYHGINVY